MNRRMLAALAAATATAGCGTTVSGVGTTAATSTSGGLSVPSSAPSSTGAVTAAGGTASRTGRSPVGSSTDPRTGGSSTGAGPATGSSSTAAAGGSAASLPPTGRGYDVRHVFIGFPTNNDVSTAAPKGIGVTNFGDQQAQVKAVVADVNSRGGLLGRTVVPVFHDIRTADLESDPENAAQATCTAFTDDHPVVAVVNIVATIDRPTLYSCLAKHQTPIVTAGFIPIDDQALDAFAPYLYKLTGATFDVLTPVWISHLLSMGYFHGWDTTGGSPAPGKARVGLLYPDIQPQVRIFAKVRSTLEARGVDVVKEYQYDVSSLDAESSGMANAVLQFRNSNVTHVLSSESDALLFMEAADSQHYRPRYGLTSYHAPAAQLQGTVPASQLTGSMGVGWLPVSDVDSAHNPGPVGPGERSCRRVMARAGEDISSVGAAVVALALCDGVHAVVDGVAAAGDPSAAGLRAGLTRIGPQFESALTWRSAFSSDRADLPGAVREFAFDGSAFRYVSSRRYQL